MAPCFVSTLPAFGFPAAARGSHPLLQRGRAPESDGFAFGSPGALNAGWKKNPARRLACSYAHSARRARSVVLGGRAPTLPPPGTLPCEDMLCFSVLIDDFHASDYRRESTCHMRRSLLAASRTAAMPKLPLHARSSSIFKNIKDKCAQTRTTLNPSRVLCHAACTQHVAESCTRDISAAHAARAYPLRIAASKRRSIRTPSLRRRSRSCARTRRSQRPARLRERRRRRCRQR